ncbi:MAG: SDR family NAD(P)-dependent oxidoreductase [Planctomycetes bacterium]|nr:SDR family NAD(P)-dependent oxidoreductase [Planctomycetota bacterium]
MSADMQGRTAVVAGAAGALGSALVERLLDAKTVVHAIVSPRHGEAPSSWANHVTMHRADLRDDAAVSAVYAGIDNVWASLQAVGGFAVGPIESTTAEEARRMFEINAVSALLCSRAAAKRIRLTGAGGRIVNVSARPVLAPVAGLTAYAMSKAAVAALTQTLAVELRPDRILVNAIVPSLIDSPANRAAMPDADHAVWPTAAQVADVMLHLASPANVLTSGALVPVYGGA